MKNQFFINEIKLDQNGHNEDGILVTFKQLSGGKSYQWLVDPRSTSLEKEDLELMVSVLNEHFIPTYQQRKKEQLNSVLPSR